MAIGAAHEPAAPMATPALGIEVLTSSQLHALFDILTHHETYAEVERFKDPRTISEYGYPFAQRSAGLSSTWTYATDSSAPLLAGVLRSIVLPLPGVRDLPSEFWHERFQGVLEKLAAVELSESYDKGTLGTRKTLATAASAIHEAVSRGLLGGVVDGAKGNLHGVYDRAEARDLVRAFDDAVQELVYGDLVEELFARAGDRESLEEHSPGVQAAADYIILHLATLMHHVFVLSPEGPYLLKLLENVHRLLPYSVIKQTLRIGNAATMLNGMMRLLLAKMSVGALSNWIGLTQNADDGMNLLQRIISAVLSWDALEFRKSAEAIERSKGEAGPSEEQLAAIRSYIQRPRKEREETRKASLRNAQPIVATILERSDPSLLASLSRSQHDQCSEYLSALLEARDRDEITDALCRQNPDLFTQAIRDAVAAFEPMIRAIHQRVDLREHVAAAENFITDFINVGKAKKRASQRKSQASGGIQIPSVEDYVVLLRNNRHLVYNWLHQVASQCPEVKDDFCSWAKDSIKLFRPSRPILNHGQDRADRKQRPGAAGALSDDLQRLFASLPPETQSQILPAINAHATYLSALEDLSLTRMQRILNNINVATANSAAHPPPPVAPKPDSQAVAVPTPAASYLSPSYWSSSRPGSRSTSPTPSPPNRNPTPNSQAQALQAAGSSFAGPGMYLSRWQQLLDDTLITPAVPGGPFRRGRDVKGRLARGKTTTTAVGRDRDRGSRDEAWDSALLAKAGAEVAEEEPSPPDVGVVVEALGNGFRELVGRFVSGSQAAGLV